ncbi:MAG TPA: hypothetical protein VM870_03500 [Pyrinomonadaceae bacterium]|nr:hypothetical protein [Pyrinomonadaceae bacterium]
MNFTAHKIQFPITSAEEWGDPLKRRVMLDYGALYAASPRVVLPETLVFTDEAEVQAFQRRAGWTADDFDGVMIELQPAAMEELRAARAAAQGEDLTITPRGGSEAARRSYADTLRLWESRYAPALAYWRAGEHLSAEDEARLRALEPREQIAAVLELEARGLFFSKDFSKSVFYSVAPPGASQHLSMLAFDVTEFYEPRVRRILAQHGWFQTVRTDLPHFTFLGLAEETLPAHGLTRVETDGQIFWVPNEDHA